MKVAFVSGNSKGIGRSITLRLISKGYLVPIHYRSSEKEARELKEYILKTYQIELPTIRADLMIIDEVKRLSNFIAENYGFIDVLVNNVGDYLYKNILELSIEEWNYIINSNLNTAFNLTQSLLSFIKRRIVFMGFAGTDKVKAYPFTTAYNVAKTGLLIYAKSLAKMLASKNITVNVIGVGVAENSVTKPINEIPMKRTAKLEEICDLLEFLISERADYITGQLIEISGGWKL